MTEIKIWTQKELNRGYIPSDKITRRGVRFEHIGLSHFNEKYLNSEKMKRMVVNFRKENKINELIIFIKSIIVESERYKKIVSEGYHTHIYLNINYDGVDCYLNR